MAKALSEIPSDAAFSAAFAATLHSQCRLHAPLGAFMSAHALLAATSAALGLAVGAAAPRAEQALAVGAPIMVIHMLVGVIDPAGADAESDGALMSTLRTLSPIRHAIEALCLAELKDVRFAKSSGGKGPGFMRALADAPKLGALAGVRNGNEVLERLGVPENFSAPMVGLGSLGALHLLAGLVALIATAPRFARARPPADS